MGKKVKTSFNETLTSDSLLTDMYGWNWKTEIILGSMLGIGIGISNVDNLSIWYGLTFGLMLHFAVMGIIFLSRGIFSIRRDIANAIKSIILGICSFAGSSFILFIIFLLNQGA